MQSDEVISKPFQASNFERKGIALNKAAEERTIIVGFKDNAMHIFSLMNSIQQYLFPLIESGLGPLTEKEKEFVRIAEVVQAGKHLKHDTWRGNGRKPCSRLAMFLAFLAKPHWGIPTTKGLVDYIKANPRLCRLCGWEGEGEVPSEPTFSRAFREFSESQLPSQVHGFVVESSFEGRMAGHSSMDSTEVEAREKALGKPKKEKAAKPKGRQKPGPKKGTKYRKERLPKRMELQAKRSLEENLLDLPCLCDCGVKRNSRGHMHTWKGYKLHLAVADGGIPTSAVLTSASLHDSQAAIPLMQMGSKRAAILYDLADTAYEADLIKDYSRSLGHVPIIEPSKRNGKGNNLCPAEKARLKERSAVERAFSNLKDNYGGRSVRVKGGAKVMAHLMFGVLALTAMQLIRLLE
jgi:hypothetical protein